VKIEKKSLNYVKTGLTSFLIALLLGIYIGYAAVPSSTFTISPGVYPGAPSFTVWREGSNDFVKDANGLIVYSGTNSSAVINSALNALTSGRTWYEKVVVIGNFILTSTVTLVGWLNLDLTQASFTRGANFAQAMFYLPNSNDHVIIQGGYLDGVKSVYTADYTYGFRFYNSSDIIVDNVYIKNTYWECIYFEYPNNVTLQNSVIDSSSREGVSVFGTNSGFGETNVRVFNTEFRNNNWDGLSLQASTKVRVDNCNFYMNGYKGINLVSVIDARITSCIFQTNNNFGIDIRNLYSITPAHISIVGCYFYQNQGGITINNATDISVVACAMEFATWQGIDIEDSYRVQVSSNYIRDCSQSPTQTSAGIRVNNGMQCIIVGNNIFDDQTPKTQRWAIQTAGTSDENIIMSNHCFENADGTSDIVYVGSDNKIVYNFGRYTPQGST
jgi:hypothetical protein